MDNLYFNLDIENLLSKYRRVSFGDTLKKKITDRGFNSNQVEAKYGINL